MIVTPVFYTCTLLISILSGLLFFGYFEEMNETQSKFFASGTILIIFGCIFLGISH